VSRDLLRLAVERWITPFFAARSSTDRAVSRRGSASVRFFASRTFLRAERTWDLTARLATRAFSFVSTRFFADL